VQKIEVYRRLSRLRRLERLEDFRQEMRDRFGPLPEAAEWLMRLAEVRLLAARWQVTSVHLEDQNTKYKTQTTNNDQKQISKTKTLEESYRPVDLVLGYRNPRRMERLVKRSEGRLRIVDASSAYYRLRREELEPMALFACLQQLLRIPERTQVN
jgi:transcription-repair coupling factor (superfamily II helicase)